MFKFDFKKIKKIFNFNFFEWLYLNRSFGWFFLILFFIFLNFVIIFFNIFLYYRIDRGEIFIVNEEIKNEEKTMIIDKSNLNKIISNFNLKLESLKKLKKEEGVDIIDPSI